MPPTLTPPKGGSSTALPREDRQQSRKPLTLEVVALAKDIFLATITAPGGASKSAEYLARESLARAAAFYEIVHAQS